MSRERKKKGSIAENAEGKEDEYEEMEWPQFPYTAEQLVKAVLTPVKSEERKKRLGISDDEE